ncbi:MAG: DUF2330 domain-containing protein [Chloroflexi bacterium]|nr:DUF2330 domain-containing protein [Chloroflexota bacterium]
MRRMTAALAVALLAMLTTTSATLACGGLIGPNGAVNLLRTSTLAGYHAGVEHYITAFEFAGGGGAFGSITPLPGVPSDVVKGGDWTLQRLVRETEPVDQRLRFDAFASAPATSGEAQVILERRIDALDITVLKGGADEVGLWAKNHGFRLPPDAPEVLEFYASRSPIFLAAAFDADAAAQRGQDIGDGTPIHVTIPTTNPWVPLRILGLGKSAAERIEADVYLLTDRQPALLPSPRSPGLDLAFDEAASDLLLDDLRSDTGMEWVPDAAWLTKIRIDASPGQLRFDLAIDATGQRTPSRVAAGFDTVAPGRGAASDRTATSLLGVGVTFIVLGLIALVLPVTRRRWARGR